VGGGCLKQSKKGSTQRKHAQSVHAGPVLYAGERKRGKGMTWSEYATPDSRSAPEREVSTTGR